MFGALDEVLFNFLPHPNWQSFVWRQLEMRRKSRGYPNSGYTVGTLTFHSDLLYKLRRFHHWRTNGLHSCFRLLEAFTSFGPELCMFTDAGHLSLSSLSPLKPAQASVWVQDASLQNCIQDIIIILSKIKDKENSKTKQQETKFFLFKGTPIKLSVDFSVDTAVWEIMG